MPQALKARLEEIDRLVRAGRGTEARRLLAEVIQKKIPREWLQTTANCLRRTDSPAIAVRLLHPVVRPSHRRAVDASPGEKAEYAAALIRLGAIEESLVLLKEVESSVPEALLFESFALVAHWNYREAIPVLKRYLEHKALTEYQRLVGKANLAAALIYEKDKSAAELVPALVTECRASGHGLLLGKTLALAAQQAIIGGDWKAAESRLAEAEAKLGPAQTLDGFLLLKWRAVLARLRSPHSPEGKAALSSFRQQAIGRGHWESIRQCDFYECLVTRNAALASHVYFGTPFAPFRQKLVEELGPIAEGQDGYTWKLGEGGARVTVDVSRGTASTGGDPLKTGQILHRLLTVLASDFYRPIRLAALHHKIYPDEHFNPLSSPVRVHRVLGRLRDWLAARKIPLSIEADSQGYRLSAKSSVWLQVPAPGVAVDQATARLALLREKWPALPFSASEAGEQLGSTARTGLLVIRGGLESGVLERIGTGRKTRYRFAA